MNKLHKYLENIAKQELDTYVYVTGEYGFPKMPEGYAAIQQYGIMTGPWDFADTGVYPTTFINLRTGEKVSWAVTDETKIKLMDNELCMYEDTVFVDDRVMVSKVFSDGRAESWDRTYLSDLFVALAANRAAKLPGYDSVAAYHKKDLFINKYETTEHCIGVSSDPWTPKYGGLLWFNSPDGPISFHVKGNWVDFARYDDGSFKKYIGNNDRVMFCLNDLLYEGGEL